LRVASLWPHSPSFSGDCWHPPGQTVTCTFRLKSLAPNPTQPSGTISFQTQSEGRFSGTSSGRCTLLTFSQSEAFCVTSFTVPTNESFADVEARFRGTATHTKAVSGAGIDIRA
jgi:hypothetical protein